GLDREVPAREVTLERVPVLDDRLARPDVVGLGPVRRHLDDDVTAPRADRPELAPDVPVGVAPACEEPLGLLGAGGGGEVEVVAHPPEERVADGAADEREVVAGVGEHVPEREDVGRQGRQRLRGRSDERLRRGRGYGGGGHPPKPATPRTAGVPRQGPRQPSPAPCSREVHYSDLMSAAVPAPRRRVPTPPRRRLTHVRPAPLPVVDETSAGGLVVDVVDGLAYTAVIARRNRAGRLEWCLPKGHLEGAETAEEAAVREIAEETGIDGRILRRLGVIDYWFSGDEHRVHKVVHHFLLGALHGELTVENDPD